MSSVFMFLFMKAIFGVLSNFLVFVYGYLVFVRAYAFVNRALLKSYFLVMRDYFPSSDESCTFVRLSWAQAYEV